MTYILNKLDMYLYEIEFASYDYGRAREYYANTDIHPGACSAVRKGNLYGRNFDYPFSNLVEFVVHAEPKGKHKSIGIASSIPELTRSVLESGEFIDAFDIIPFATVDGMNDAGVVCNVNVVPGDYGHATGTNPDADETIYTPMVVRYILDNADSASDAIAKLLNVNIVNSGRVPYDVHWMIADANETYILEYIDGDLEVVENASIMSNFYNYGFDGNTATAFYNPDDYDPDDTTLTEHASGLERYDILADGYEEVSDVKSMKALMDSVKYTKTYSEGKWLSEFCGDNGSFGELTINSLAEDFDDILSYAQNLYKTRKRDGKTWQTMHSSIYDMARNKLYVVCQEGKKEFIFNLNRKKDKPMSLFKRFADTFAKHDVPIENEGGAQYTVTFSTDDFENFTCDKTITDIFAHADNVKFVLFIENVILHAIVERVEPTSPVVYVMFNVITDDTLQNIIIIYNDDGVSGSCTYYTLTPVE